MVHHKPMLGTGQDWPAYLSSLQQTLAQVEPEQIRSWSSRLFQAYQQDRQVLIIGNGGSATNAAHFCQDFSKSLTPEDLAGEDNRPRLRTLNLTDLSGWLLAAGNDLGFDQVFEQPLRTLGRPGDVLIALSGSGQSANIINAVKYAKRKGIHTIGLTGFDGGQLMTLADQVVHVPCQDMGLTESIHLCLFHWVLDDLYARINQIGRYSADHHDTTG